MNHPVQHCLERIQEGLPVQVIPRQQLVEVHYQLQGQARCCQLPLVFLRDQEASSPSKMREAFDGTLEVFEGNHRLTANEIEALDPEQVLRDPSLKVRLVLNHTQQGDPTGEVDWQLEGLEVVKRPLVLPLWGEAAWHLAQHLPCQEVRLFTRNEEGSWQVTAPPAHPAPGRDQDYYLEQVANIPTQSRCVACQPSWEAFPTSQERWDCFRFDG